MKKLSETIFAKYIEAREGAEILENEFGFIIYKINEPAKECFIKDLCIDECHRYLGKGKDLIELLSEIAQKEGCHFLSGNIFLSDPGHTDTLMFVLTLGFKIQAAHNGCISVTKGLEA